MKAPGFRLVDQDGNSHTLSDYAGKWVVIYFYPKDNTPGCTKEACGFRDQAEAFVKRGAVVIGISKDSVASHKKFADKYHLTFPLLSDPDHSVIEQFGAWGKKKFLGREYEGTHRNTYLIDPKGNIVKEYKSVSPLTHVPQILSDLDQFQHVSR